MARRISKHLFLLALGLIFASCSRPDSLTAVSPIADSAAGARPFSMGIAGFFPRNFPNSADADILDFTQELPRLGEFFGVYAAWDDPFLDRQIEFAQGIKGITPLVATGFDYSLVNEGYFIEKRDAILEKLIGLAKSYDLTYLGFGGEVNRLASEKSPDIYLEFIQVYKEVYDALKTALPDLQVFTVFQYEMMTGNARLSGLEGEPQWDSLASFEGKMDLAAFTVYPFLEYLDVGQIPADYFAELDKFATFPVIISETAWPSENVEVNGQLLVSGGEGAQVDYLNWIASSAEAINARILMYAVLHDFPIDHELFQRIGLKENDGTPKLAYTQWRSLAELQNVPGK